MAKYSLMMARFPGGGVERHESSSYFMNLLHGPLRRSKDLDYENIVGWKKSDTPIDMVRNDCAWDAVYRDKVDYLLCIDSDMAPDQPGPGAEPFWETAWEWMLAHRDQPGIIAAPYCGPPPWENVYIFTWSLRQSDAPPGGGQYVLDQYSREHAAAMGGIGEVAALPTGLMLIDTRVFQIMEAKNMLPWFAYEWTDKYRRRKASTEDVFFTRNASLCGAPVWCAWNSWAQHVKTKAVGRPLLFGPDDVRDARLEASVLPTMDARERQLSSKDLEKAMIREELEIRRRAVIGPAPGMTFEERRDAERGRG